MDAQFYIELDSLVSFQFCFSDIVEQFSFCEKLYIVVLVFDGVQSLHKLISGYSSIFSEKILLYYVICFTL